MYDQARTEFHKVYDLVGYIVKFMLLFHNLYEYGPRTLWFELAKFKYCWWITNNFQKLCKKFSDFWVFCRSWYTMLRCRVAMYYRTMLYTQGREQNTQPSLPEHPLGGTWCWLITMPLIKPTYYTRQQSYQLRSSPRIWPSCRNAPLHASRTNWHSGSYPNNTDASRFGPRVSWQSIMKSS